MATARLEIAYDGRRFAGWAAQPGQRTVQGELEAALERILGERGRADRRRAHRRRRPRARPGGELRARARASGPARRAAERRAAARRRRARGRARRPTASTPAATRSRAPTATGCSPRRSATRSRRAGRCGGATRSTARLLDECAAAVVGTHDFTAFTPTQTEHVAVRAHRRRLRLGRRSDPIAAGAVESRPRRSCAAGPGPGRDDARGRRRPAHASRTSARCSPARPASGPARRRRRTASTSSRSPIPTRPDGGGVEHRRHA